jgi:hypothetical protein
MERMDRDLPARRLVGPGIDDAVRAPTVFTENRDRLPTTGVPRKSLPRT